MTSKLTFLTLPNEVRALIYASIFGEERLICNICLEDREWPQVYDSAGRGAVVPALTPIPFSKPTELFNILLTCHQCYEEGIVVYYQEARVETLSHIDSKWWGVPLPYHASDEDLVLPKPIVADEAGPNEKTITTLPAGTRSNLSMVLKHSKYFWEGTPEKPLGLYLQLRSMRHVLFQRGPMIDPDNSIMYLSAFTKGQSRKEKPRPLDIEINYYFAAMTDQRSIDEFVPPENLESSPPTTPVRGGLTKPMMGIEEDVLASLNDLIAERPGVKFSMDIDAFYYGFKDDCKEYHEVAFPATRMSQASLTCLQMCEFDLRSQKVINRMDVSREESEDLAMRGWRCAVW